MMKRTTGIFVLLLAIICSACNSQKSMYQTRTGKKKQRFYNDIQYGRNAHPKKTW